jgi:acyl carrier protein
MNMMNNEKFKSLQNLIAQNLGVDFAAVTLKANLIEDLGADSLDAMHLLVAINEAFGTNIPPEKVEKIKSVSDLWDLIQVS